jgi:hypothetical protein
MRKTLNWYVTDEPTQADLDRYVIIHQCRKGDGAQTIWWTGMGFYNCTFLWGGDIWCYADSSIPK